MSMQYRIRSHDEPYNPSDYSSQPLNLIVDSPEYKAAINGFIKIIDCNEQVSSIFRSIISDIELAKPNCSFRELQEKAISSLPLSAIIGTPTYDFLKKNFIEYTTTHIQKVTEAIMGEMPECMSMEDLKSSIERTLPFSLIGGNSSSPLKVNVIGRLWLGKKTNPNLSVDNIRRLPLSSIRDSSTYALEKRDFIKCFVADIQNTAESIMDEIAESICSDVESHELGIGMLDLEAKVIKELPLRLIKRVPCSKKDKTPDKPIVSPSFPREATEEIMETARIHAEEEQLYIDNINLEIDNLTKKLDKENSALKDLEEAETKIRVDLDALHRKAKNTKDKSKITKKIIANRQLLSNICNKTEQLRRSINMIESKMKKLALKLIR